MTVPVWQAEFVTVNGTPILSCSREPRSDGEIWGNGSLNNPKETSWEVQIDTVNEKNSATRFKAKEKVEGMMLKAIGHSFNKHTSWASVILWNGKSPSFWLFYTLFQHILTAFWFLSLSHHRFLNSLLPCLLLPQIPQLKSWVSATCQAKQEWRNELTRGYSD